MKRQYRRRTCTAKPIATRVESSDMPTIFSIAQEIATRNVHSSRASRLSERFLHRASRSYVKSVVVQRAGHGEVVVVLRPIGLKIGAKSPPDIGIVTFFCKQKAAYEFTV